MSSSDIQQRCKQPEALAHWLEGLEQLEDIAAANQLYAFLSQLKKQPGLFDAHVCLAGLTALPYRVHTLAKGLEKLHLKNPQQPKIAQLNTALLRQSAWLLTQCAQVASSTTQCTAWFNHALYFQGLAHYTSVLAYQRPSGSLWRDMGQTYQRALQADVVDSPLEPDTVLDARLNTLHKTLKRTLLFTISNPYRLSVTEIQKWFDFCAEIQPTLQWQSATDKTTEGWIWHYDNEQLPIPWQADDNLKNSLRFHSDELHKAHRLGQINWPLQNPAILLHTLNHYKDIANSTAMALPSHHVFISETERVMTFFQKHIREGLVWTMNSPSPVDLNFSSLELHQESTSAHRVERVSRDAIWGDGKKDDVLSLHEFGAMKAYKTDAPGFFVTESIRAPLHHQDLLALYGKELMPSLAIVRRLEYSPNKNVQKALIQVLPGKVTPVILQEEGSGIALLLNHQEEMQCFVLPQRLDTKRVLKTQQCQLVLNKVMEVTVSFMRFAVESVV